MIWVVRRVEVKNSKADIFSQVKIVRLNLHVALTWRDSIVALWHERCHHG